MEDFYSDAASENTRVVRILVRQADGGTPTIGPTLATTRWATLVQNVSLGLFANIKPALDKMIAAQVEPIVNAMNFGVVASLHPALERWHAAQSERFAIQMKPLVRSVNLGILANEQPATGKLRAQLELIAEQAQAVRAHMLADIAAAAQPWPTGGGVVRHPMAVTGSGAISGVGEVVVPSGTNAWPAIAEQLQRIGAMPCGEIYAIVLVLAAFVLLPKLRDDIADAVLFFSVVNWIIRNGNR